jgi:3-mercaptopropionate dioxygenase
MTTIYHPRFNAFVAGLQALVDTAAAEPEILTKGSALLKDLVTHDDWLPAEYAVPNPARYTQYLLHADPKDRFSIVSFVWGPGQKTPIHNHTVWGLIGMLRGAEYSQGYKQCTDGSLAAEGAPVRLEQGTVEAVSPDIGDLHAVSNAFEDRASISIHIYGANIGKVERSIFQLDGTTKTFISGYSNA